MIHNKIDYLYSASTSSSWTREEDKLFERALVTFPEETPGRWERIARQVPGKSSVDVQRRYDDLVLDLRKIEAGLVELPGYEDEMDSPGRVAESGASLGSNSNRSRERETERRKGVPWTAEEHRLFLIGLEKYGKGDWRSISRNAVVSRTPTQVASHAQKYFLRMNSVRKDKKRSSIHDITTVDAGSSSQSYDPSWVGPLTDQLETHQLGSPSDFNDQGRSIGGFHSFGFPM
ncbi:Duplicated homeodomain-like superfamily protein [Citrus sinensis]|uniref:transcription factor SRM1-like n=1 Tax=Citrus sinensis TaxID=2711 RepID=UPI0003D71830|nr:transcription factor SRM1-like [Citrus sinensis]KAH9659839.1 Duplicated homeodomain-like superfamily protein [Citrus sinensis]